MSSTHWSVPHRYFLSNISAEDLSRCTESLLSTLADFPVQIHTTSHLPFLLGEINNTRTLGSMSRPSTFINLFCQNGINELIPDPLYRLFWLLCTWLWITYKSQRKVGGPVFSNSFWWRRKIKARMKRTVCTSGSVASWTNLTILRRFWWHQNTLRFVCPGAWRHGKITAWIRPQTGVVRTREAEQRSQPFFLSSSIRQTFENCWNCGSPQTMTREDQSPIIPLLFARQFVDSRLTWCDPLGHLCKANSGVNPFQLMGIILNVCPRSLFSFNVCCEWWLRRAIGRRR